MSKANYYLFSAMLLGAASLMTTACAEEPQQVEAPAAEAQPQAAAPQAQDPAAQSSEAPQAAAPQKQDPTAQAPAAENEQAQNQAKPDPAHPYEIQYFFADFQRFDIGSVIPDRYRTKKYEIIDWKTRNLPQPAEGTSWTYMGGNYVLFSKADGKIIKAESGDIFYKQ